jgi:hypothetical protein
MAISPFGRCNLPTMGTGTNNYYVASSPGQLLHDNAIVIGTGAGTRSPTARQQRLTIFGIDAPYATENGKKVTSFTTAPDRFTYAGAIFPDQRVVGMP